LVVSQARAEAASAGAARRTRRKALERVVRYCDGWMPISLRAGDLKKEIAELRETAKKAGRDPKSISISVFWAPADRAKIDEYEEMGVERAILALPPAPRDKVLPILDSHAKLVR
jgi:alkanesulfonate monooxygenase SsuD/methylene tetrahydromethanopterin reductase-like flavin-dependent oxidoreductase (luciferase family)